MEIKYKDSTNKVHQIPEGSEHLMAGWPVGYTLITDAEAEVLLAQPLLTLREAKDKRITYINAEADKEMGQMVASYPRHEVDTWAEQVKEAEAYTLDLLASTPLLSGIALGAGVTVAAIAAVVLQKRDALKALTGPVIGKRKLKTAQIEAVQVINGDEDAARAQVEAIVW